MPRCPAPRSVKRVFRPLKPYQLVVDVVVGGLFGLAMLWPELEAGRMVAMNALSAVLVCVLFAGALAVRRLAPGLALAVAWTGAIVQMAFVRPPSAVDLAIFAVLYATAAYGGRAVFWAGFGSAILGAAVITVYLFAGNALAPVSWSLVTAASATLVAALFALLLSWTVGALVRTGIRARENRRAQERAEAESAAEQERVRIARDMHDVVAHSLAVVVAQADGARYAIAAGEATSSGQAVAAEALGTISHTARAALADVRMLLAQLRHREGDGPQPTLADLEQVFAQVRAAGVDLRVDIDPAPPSEPPAAVQLAVFRILQEALTNALRHGAQGRVDVRLAWRRDRVDIEVHNALPAVAVPATPEPRGHGVIGMRERAQLAGGRLEAGADGDSFVVRGTIPIGAADDAP